MKYKVES